MNHEPNKFSEMPKMLLPKLSIKTYKPDESFIHRALDIENLIQSQKPAYGLPNRDRPHPKF